MCGAATFGRNLTYPLTPSADLEESWSMAGDQTQLVSRCLSGERAAQEELYALHARCVLAYFLRSGFLQADAEDLTQEAFARAFAYLGGYDPSRGAFGGWLFAIVRNVARKHWKNARDVENYDPQLAEETLCRDNCDGDPGIATQQQEEFAALRDCLSALPPDVGNLVRLRYVEARTTRGVGQAAGLPESTVRLRLAEAKNMLERCLRGKGVLE
jgi:RNA polymerase sigma-70 factor (ECF subfamily)